MPRVPRIALAAAGAAVAMAALTGCTGTSDVLPSSSTTQEGTEVDLQSVYRAVVASDSRVEDPLGTVSYSGTAQTLSLSVLVRGDEPVTTDTVTAILIAIRENTPAQIETVTVVARDADDEEKILSLSDAVAGLPSELTPLVDGGVTLMRTDLDKLGR